MRLLVLYATLVCVCISVSATAHAQPVEVKNDGFVDGGSASFQGGFVVGEIAAARFDPTTAGSGSYSLTEIRLIFGGGTAGVEQTVRIHVWADEAGADPGTELYTGTFMLTATDDALASIALTDAAVPVTGKFRVGVEFMHDGFPSVARDGDGITADVNFVQGVGIGWVEASTLGITGDWIIRAVVDVAGGPDGGFADGGALPDAGRDGGAADGGAGCALITDCPAGQYCDVATGACAMDCSADMDCASGQMCSDDGMCVAATADDGGCSCRAAGAGARGPSGALFGLLALGLGVVARRRR